MKRILLIAGILAAACGALLWFLLLISTSADTVIFARYYPQLLGLNMLVVATLVGLVAWQLRKLWREAKTQVFGSRLKLRLVIMFGLVSVIPGILIYAVSVQFMTRSIDSWFDVRVEKALESGLNLGRNALDSLLHDLEKKARSMALELSDKSPEDRRSVLFHLRDQLGIESVALFRSSGELLVSDQANLGSSLLLPPSPADLRQLRLTRLLAQTEGESADQLRLRVLTLINGPRIGDEPVVLQLLQPVPTGLAQNAADVQAVYQDYQELQLAHNGLTQIYALTLTLTVLVALLGAFGLAFYLARRLVSPLYMLAQGTQAVAQGDFSSRLTFSSRDELGGLTESFNQMTTQLEDARLEANQHRQDVESARAYLETILANLSAGVLVFDRDGILRILNQGALGILGNNFEAMLNQPVEAWTIHRALGDFIQDHFQRPKEDHWESQYEMSVQHERPRVLLLRGTYLPATNGGKALVFDDVTTLISAQRTAAWGEVARRLAHEIKNPLTPIQLSAERLQMRLANRLDQGEAEFLRRSTQTIINQVQAMKHMVDDFRDYARMPLPQLIHLNLNELVQEILGLYESSQVLISQALEEGLPSIQGDPTQLRQVIHNLLRNAEDVLEGREDGRIEVSTAWGEQMVMLCISDNGPGFPPEILPKVFEPYVTTKPKGTGLGLPIVKKIIDEHRGRIDIGATKTGGGRVCIYLPSGDTP